MAIQRKKFNFDAEKQVLVNLIINDDYCRVILPLIEEEYFTSKSANIIISWVTEYWEAYETAPKSGIINVFDNESEKLGAEDKDHIEKILQHLSDIGIDNQETNTDYLISKGKEFLRKRNFELRIKAAQHYLSDGKLDDAEKVLEERFDVPDELKKHKDWDDKEWVSSVISKMNRKDDPDAAYFRYRGRLGDFTGNLDAGWFVGYVGPSKRGKTIYLAETVHEGIHRRMNTLFYSLEMPDDQLLMRSLKSITGGMVAKNDYSVEVPVFDCELNQKGECGKGVRLGFGSLVNEEDELDDYEGRPDWVVCTVCRGTPDFYPSSWKVPIPKHGYNEESYNLRVNAFMRLFGKYGKTIFRPSRSATIETIEVDLYTLEHRYNWVPHIIVLDYADLIKPSRPSSQRRFELDDIWEGLRSMAQQRKTLLVTASQTNRGAADAKYIKETDVAEDYSKIAKLDLGIGLCQTEEMKIQGQMNLNKLIARHTDFIQSRTCMCLQELTHTQGTIDSEFRLK